MGGWKGGRSGKRVKWVGESERAAGQWGGKIIGSLTVTSWSSGLRANGSLVTFCRMERSCELIGKCV